MLFVLYFGLYLGSIYVGSKFFLHPKNSDMNRPLTTMEKWIFTGWFLWFITSQILWIDWVMRKLFE